jgi:nicotinamide/nicotinate riboside kinase
MDNVLQHFRQHGVLPPHHSSHDHLNEQPSLPIDEESMVHWKEAFRSALEKAQIDKVLIADGFLLYYDERIRRQMDVRLFLRCKQSTLIRRRDSRGGYATAEGTVWQVRLKGSLLAILPLITFIFLSIQGSTRLL